MMGEALFSKCLFLRMPFVLDRRPNGAINLLEKLKKNIVFFNFVFRKFPWLSESKFHSIFEIEPDSFSIRRCIRTRNVTYRLNDGYFTCSNSMVFLTLYGIPFSDGINPKTSQNFSSIN